MGVLSKCGDFLNRHRNKLVVGGIIVTGSVLLTRYAQQKLLDWQNSQAQELIERNRKQMHFEVAERASKDLIVTFIPAINEILHKVINTETLINELRLQPHNKIRIWKRLKKLIFTKITCLVYLCTLVVVASRIQINILNGFLYKDSKIFSDEQKKQYLLLVRNILDNGATYLSDLVEEKSEHILESINLNRPFKIEEIEKLFWSIQMAVSESPEDPIRNMKKILMGDSKIIGTNSLYDNMIQDTCDLLQSEEVQSLTFECINRCLSLVSDKLAEFYNIPESSDSTVDFVHPSTVQIPLAKILPIIHGLVLKSDLSEQLVQLLINDNKLKTLDANVYEAFSSNNNN